MSDDEKVDIKDDEGSDNDDDNDAYVDAEDNEENEDNDAGVNDVDTNDAEIDLDNLLNEQVNTSDGYIHRNIIVPDNERITSDMLSLFELTECVTIRSAQIEKFNNCLVDISGMTDPVAMAKKELMLRESPLICRRQVGIRIVITAEAKYKDTYYELWKVNEMKFPITYQY